MMLISVIFHAFSFLHKQINELLGKPDSVFHLQGKPDSVFHLQGKPDSVFYLQGKP